MRKSLLFLVALGIMAVVMLVAPVSSQAQSLDVRELTSVFPEYPGAESDIPRGAFAALLVNAAQIPLAEERVTLPPDVDPAAWYAPYVAALYRDGILRGYPDGTLRAQAPVTWLEAVALVSRVLGLPDGISAAGEVPGFEDTHWGYAPYSWLFTWGLVSDVDPVGKMTAGEAVEFLARVFGSDPEAEAIIEKGYQAQKNVSGLSFTGDMIVTMRPRAGVPELPPGAGEVKMAGSMSSEMVLPATLHNYMRMELELPPGLLGPGAPPVPPLEIEQYLADGVMYQKMPDPRTGEAKWVRLPKEATPDVEALLEEIWQGEFYRQAVPEELRPYLHYRLVGTTELDGREVHKIISYGCIKDFSAFVKAALPEKMQEMLGDPEVAKGMGSINELIRSMSFWVISYVGAEDYLTYGQEFEAVVGFGEEFMGESFPFEVMEMHVKVGDYKYGDIVIELPPETLEAEELRPGTTLESGGRPPAGEEYPAAPAPQAQ